MVEVSTYSKYVVELHVRVDAYVSGSLACIYLLNSSELSLLELGLIRPWGRYMAGKWSVMRRGGADQTLLIPTLTIR